MDTLGRQEMPSYNEGMRLSPDGKREYTTTEAALLMGMTRQRISEYIADDRIEYYWRGGRRYIPEHAIGVIKPSTKKGGRPRKQQEE
jgi:hypothetical protein